MGLFALGLGALVGGWALVKESRTRKAKSAAMPGGAYDSPAREVFNPMCTSTALARGCRLCVFICTW